MSKHTEGPWTVNGVDRNGQAIVTNAHIEIATCWHHCVGSIEKEMWANAHLIAAAPEMYNALQKIFDKEGWSWLIPILAEAEGRTAVKEVNNDR